MNKDIDDDTDFTGEYFQKLIDYTMLLDIK